MGVFIAGLGVIAVFVVLEIIFNNNDRGDQND